MRIKSGVSALALAAALAVSLVAPASAQPSDDEIIGHNAAYETAMSQLRYDVAETEAEAAWRGAEQSWGASEDTAILAFNLVRVRLMADRRAEAVEPALRIAELARTGNAQSIAPAEVELFTTLAQFDGVGASGREIGDLEEALAAYAPTDYVGKRIAMLGWSYAATGRARLGHDRDALPDAQRALDLAAQDLTAPTGLVGAIGIIGASAAYETDEFEDGILLAKRAIAAFPQQPPGQPLDPQLATLLLWDQGLSGIYFQEHRAPYIASDPALANPRWDDGRYAMEAGCMPAWSDRQMPRMGGGAPDGIGAVFEYQLAADGSVQDVAVYGGPSDHPGAEALRLSKAEPPSEECRGKTYYEAQAIMFPRTRSSGARTQD